ncbi:uncharacterized protein LOC112536870 [Ricinus communis]|uniref:uncharacterized protein LOC112536870 n=1 Tax=Ricinus communis TaxID=3988 RepID=UPI000D68652B|nr:uncharacterized protein LOC112536870 [Ricinus communis]|eukprot:XP_025015525.1 uncharacterized protein LOC112536870 [Ricinus communis]
MAPKTRARKEKSKNVTLNSNEDEVNMLTMYGAPFEIKSHEEGSSSGASSSEINEEPIEEEREAHENNEEGGSQGWQPVLSQSMNTNLDVGLMLLMHAWLMWKGFNVGKPTSLIATLSQ